MKAYPRCGECFLGRLRIAAVNLNRFQPYKYPDVQLLVCRRGCIYGSTAASKLQALRVPYLGSFLGTVKLHVVCPACQYDFEAPQCRCLTRARRTQSPSPVRHTYTQARQLSGSIRMLLPRTRKYDRICSRALFSVRRARAIARCGHSSAVWHCWRLAQCQDVPGSVKETRLALDSDEAEEVAATALD